MTEDGFHVIPKEEKTKDLSKDVRGLKFLAWAKGESFCALSA